MLEFKLNYYFEMYKDSYSISYKYFKDEFIKKHGDFTLLKELFIMIQKYQLEKYGKYLGSGFDTKVNVSKGFYSRRHYQRVYERFGKKDDRIRRNIEYERNL